MRIRVLDCLRVIYLEHIDSNYMESWLETSKEVKVIMRKDDILNSVESFTDYFKEADRSEKMVTVSTIANASRGELLCITYEILLENIKNARENTGKQRQDYLKKSIEVVQILAGDLNFEFDLSKELFSIYIYVQGVLINAKTDEKIEEAYQLISKLYESFKEVSKRENEARPSIDNAEIVYAGLTYGPHHLNELSMKEANRGYKV